MKQKDSVSTHYMSFLIEFVAWVLQEIQDLREQVRDLMFYLETQKKIEDSPDGAKQVCLCGGGSYVCVEVVGFHRKFKKGSSLSPSHHNRKPRLLVEKRNSK